MAQVLDRHPDVVMYRRWRDGVEGHGLVYCGGEVTPAPCTPGDRYCAGGHPHLGHWPCVRSTPQGGGGGEWRHQCLQVLVFDAASFLLETVLEGRGEAVWQIQAGGHILAAVTESCLTVWRKPGVVGQEWGVVARVRVRTGEPFLHLERDLVAVPGDSKHVCRFFFWGGREV